MSLRHNKGNFEVTVHCTTQWASQCTAILSSLNHPYCARIFPDYDERMTHLKVMTFCDGFVPGPRPKIFFDRFFFGQQSNFQLKTICRDKWKLNLVPGTHNPSTQCWTSTGEFSSSAIWLKNQLLAHTMLNAFKRWGAAHLWTLLCNGCSNRTPLLGDWWPSPPGRFVMLIVLYQVISFWGIKIHGTYIASKVCWAK